MDVLLLGYMCYFLQYKYIFVLFYERQQIYIFYVHNIRNGIVKIAFESAWSITKYDVEISVGIFRK